MRPRTRILLFAYGLGMALAASFGMRAILHHANAHRWSPVWMTIAIIALCIGALRVRPMAAIVVPGLAIGAAIELVTIGVNFIFEIGATLFLLCTPGTGLLVVAPLVWERLAQLGPTVK